MSARTSSGLGGAVVAAVAPLLPVGMAAVVIWWQLLPADSPLPEMPRVAGPVGGDAAGTRQQKHLVMQGGVFGAPPLRASLSDKPFCQTSLGRDKHRFAGEAVNEFRIYDFYARQARYYLDHPLENPEILLPFTELDGGRIGHWGGTNEPAAGAVVRTKQEVFGSFTERNGGDLQAVKCGDSGHPAVLLFNGHGDLREARLDAEPIATGNALTSSPLVDTLGFNLSVTKGRTYLLGGGPVGCRHAGTYFHGDKVIYRRSTANGSCLLDLPELLYRGDTPVLARHLVWLDQAEPLDFQLPVTESTAVGILAVQPGPSGSQLWSMPVKTGFLHHLIWQEGTALIPRMIPGDARLSIFCQGPGGRLHVLSWVDGEATGTSLAARLRAEPAPRPDDLVHGGPRRFAASIQVKGQRNADAAMAGSAYEMDDIPVPVTNPWRAPMCLSGIAFDSAGTAYVCTMTGDVWRVSGLDDDLDAVCWNRYASGLPQPMGLRMDGGMLDVCTANNIVRLHDLNNDQEADYTEVLNKMDLPRSGTGAARNGLGRDSAGNFHFSVPAGIFRMSADGTRLTAIGGMMRNPLGLATRPDGLCLSDSSEGDADNGTCSICESTHPENANSPAKRKRILYLPRGIDNSPGSRIFLDEPRFGPLGQGIIGLSYGSCSHYVILRDPNDGAPQAALMPLPGDFSAGMVQLQTNPVDGQIYAVGMDGWGDYAVAEGAMHRIRWTGGKSLMPVAWEAHANGILVRFSESLGSRGVKPEDCFAQQWNNIDSAHTYGSPDYSVAHPGQIGHDRLRVTNARVLAGGKEIFLEIPGLLPAMSTQVYAILRDTAGDTQPMDLYATINRLRPDYPGFEASRLDKPRDLTVPTLTGNGNTYQNVLTFFDQAAGRTTATRPEGPNIPFTKGALKYAWIHENLLVKYQCLACHGPGTQHDYSTYAGLMTKVNLATPAQSPLYGMLSTRSMPPWPMPSVHPGMQQAVLEWIMAGAPE